MRFSDFQFGQGTAGAYTIAMSGVAKSFNEVALQSDAFAQSDILTNPVFSNINFDQTGNVAFDVTATVDSDRILYDGTSTPLPAASTTPAVGTTTQPTL